MGDTADYGLLAQQAGALAEGAPGWLPALANVAALLGESLPDINWIGFYVAVPRLAGERDLVLGPFWGRPACVSIPHGSGVCGTAVKANAPQLVPDVQAFPGHIACDAASRSELVVPIHAASADGSAAVWGVLDCDSPTPARFSAADLAGFSLIVAALEKSANLLGPAVRPVRP
ncbi:MAG: GAF domain-containing protein [Coriobacteriaceae bacterium]|nr:GAF domain-containing protein [Coriobacteriaceae bacterium]